MFLTVQFSLLAVMLHSVAGDDAVASIKNNRSLQKVPDLPDHVPAHVLEKFKDRELIAPGVELDLQMVTGASDDFVIDGETFSLDAADLDPFIFPLTSNAVIVKDGVTIERSTLESRVFRSKANPNVVVVKRANGKLASATKIGSQSIDILPLDAADINSNVFAEVPFSALDPVKLSTLKLDVDEDPSAGGVSRQRRQLEATCDDPSSPSKVIEMAVAFDTTFCQWHSDFDGAVAKVMQIANGVSLYFQQNGLGKVVEVSHIDGYCDEAFDPYRPMLVNAGVFRDVKSSFTQYWIDTKGDVHRDTSHLFFGEWLSTNSNDSTYGFASVDALCDPLRAYAVNDISISQGLKLQTVLVTHELGHNAGANHVDSCVCGDDVACLMCPNLGEGDGTWEFSADSINDMCFDFLYDYDCITAPSSPPECGDGFCNGVEDASSCPEDCSCGDGICDDGVEDASSCPADCPCLVGGQGLGCTSSTFCCSGSCTGGKPSRRTCSSSAGDVDPNPVPAPSAPVPSAPVPSTPCRGNKAPCTGPDDCCSGKCTGGTCKGNGRLLRSN